MQNQKNLLTLGLASLGAISMASPSEAAHRATNDITEFSVTAEEAATRIIITGSQAFTPEVKSFGKSGVTTITLPGVWQAGKAGVQNLQKNGVAFVRYGQYAMKPSKQVRIVANYSGKLRQPLKHELVPSEDKTRWEVVLYAPGAEPSDSFTTELRPVQVASIAAAPPGLKSVHYHVALATDKDPIPSISVRDKRAAISVDTHALMVAATRVASSVAIAPMNTTAVMSNVLVSAPKLSLASVLSIAPRTRPLVPTIATASALTPYPSRTATPKAPPQVAALPSKALPPKDALVTLAQALSAPVTRATEPTPARSPISITAAAPVETLTKTASQENTLDRIVKLDVVNGELTDVLKLIQMQAKVNVVSGQSVVNKKVTLSLDKVPLRDALDWVTRLSGVAYTMEGNNTIIVGTGQEISLLKRTNQTPEAISASIPFYYADADSLKTALTSSFPNVTIHIIRASDESKKEEENTQQGSSVQAATGERVAVNTPGNASGSSMTSLKPRGGSIYVVGTRSIVEEIQSTIADMEKGLIEIAQRDSDRKADQLRSFVNDTYEVKYVDPSQAARLILESVPNLIVRPGPSQRFIATALGVGGALGQGGGTGAGGGMGAGSGGAQGGGMGAAAGGAQGGQGQGGQGQGGGLVESRLLLLTGKESDVKRAKEMLNQLDVKPPQFIYEARLVEMSKDNATKLGLTYDLGRAIQIGENDLGGQPNTTVNGIAGGRQPNGGAIFRTPYSIATKIDALATLGKANILARPTLSALDGNQAVTFIGDQVPYVISQSIGPTGGLNVQTGIASAGIRLQVSGRSNGDGTMTIYVHPEISTITQFVGGLPQISTRFVDTMIRVKNGETIAIGGLVQKTEIDNMRKIPLIGDLPILGQLFRSSDKSIKESEVLIFITCSLSKD
ncbi:MAG: hypothetical protein NTX57_13445 [Armatimonadetes bacterium]|nr:hypothetical protein [Armatimonadota bacterium]